MRQRAQNYGFVLHVQLCVLTAQNRRNYQELSLVTPGGVSLSWGEKSGAREKRGSNVREQCLILVIMVKRLLIAVIIGIMLTWLIDVYDTRVATTSQIKTGKISPGYHMNSDIHSTLFIKHEIVQLTQQNIFMFSLSLFAVPPDLIMSPFLFSPFLFFVSFSSHLLFMPPLFSLSDEQSQSIRSSLISSGHH